jgi:hypothetical protein
LLFPVLVAGPGPAAFHIQSSFIELFLPHAYPREGMNQSKYIQEPEHHYDDDDGVQDRLDASCHGDEAIHQPQQNANYDQDCNKLN